jgi:hypothetical protein
VALGGDAPAARVIIPFKRPVYEKVVSAFAPLAPQGLQT